MTIPQQGDSAMCPTPTTPLYFWQTPRQGTKWPAFDSGSVTLWCRELSQIIAPRFSRNVSFREPTLFAPSTRVAKRCEYSRSHPDSGGRASTTRLSLVIGPWDQAYRGGNPEPGWHLKQEPRIRRPWRCSHPGPHSETLQDSRWRFFQEDLHLSQQGSMLRA